MTRRIFLQIDGMTCSGCAAAVRLSLSHRPGVLSCEVDWRSGLAEVIYDPGLVGEEALVEAAGREGEYQPVVISPHCC